MSDSTRSNARPIRQEERLTQYLHDVVFCIVQIDLNTIISANTSRMKILPPKWHKLHQSAPVRFHSFLGDFCNQLISACDRGLWAAHEILELFAWGLAEYALTVLNCQQSTGKFFSKNAKFAVPAELIREREMVCTEINKLKRKKRRMKVLDREFLLSYAERLRYLKSIRKTLSAEIVQLRFSAERSENDSWFKKRKWNFINVNVKSSSSAPTDALKMGDIESYFENICNPQNLSPLDFSWINKLKLKPINTGFVEADILPGDVKAILSHKDASAGSGLDGINYSFLKPYPEVHKCLAAMFNRLLLSGTACSSWKVGKTVLLYKKGDFGMPGNYRPITLTSCIGKVFHSVISSRLMSYCVKNKIIDTDVQKGFIEATNGCGEHSLKLLKLIEQQGSKRHAMHVAWLDIANAYPSIRKEVLLAALRRYKLS
ncbi:uncharacterized protein LOC129592603 [Paramacrobiotus metropolitanus]|uniref:uncharacterized protein LOC129592603 n=1 Tax=Paramacrobiotus metropolitanus TaxID=2943436 RepID=UPI002445C576|nr:uncharacterized protein LOC129592603 [Paramacrobiotus metropolitanus]